MKSRRSILSNTTESGSLVMTRNNAKRPSGRTPVHPGEVVREDVLPALGLSVSEAARRLGVSRQQIHRVLACTHPVTTEMALRIGKLAGNGPRLWLKMQQNHDLWHAERRLKADLAKIETAKAGTERVAGSGPG